jgi:hypothetical protein
MRTPEGESITRLDAVCERTRISKIRRLAQSLMAIIPDRSSRRWTYIFCGGILGMAWHGSHPLIQNNGSTPEAGWA